MTASSHLPCLFSTMTVYFPASFRTIFSIVSDVFALVVSVLKRFGSGSFSPLNDHVTFGCGLAANGTSTTVEPPTGRVSVSVSSLVNRGVTVDRSTMIRNCFKQFLNCLKLVNSYLFCSVDNELRLFAAMQISCLFFNVSH